MTVSNGALHFQKRNHKEKLSKDVLFRIDMRFGL
jgi:hypothetical protein